MLSRAHAALLAAGALVVPVACNALAGLDDYEKVACADDCGAPDVADVVPAADVVDAASATPPPDALPPAHRTWAHWKMPNAADAEADSNVASYAPANAGEVRDAVTGMTWSISTGSASTIAEARRYCDTMPPAGIWTLPTRIELASLIDPTRSKPALDPAGFPDASGGAYWTASPVHGQIEQYWWIDFDDGSVRASAAPAARLVRCVHGVAQ